MNHLRLLALTASLSAGVAALPGYSLQAQRRTDDAPTADTVFNVSRNGVIDITLRSGRLVVRGTERSSGELRANGTRYQLRSSGVTVALAMDETSDRRSARSSRNRDGDEPDVLLLVPRNVRLIVNGRSSDVSVTGVAGDVEINNHNGDIHLESLGGRAIVETVSGDIRVTGGVGDFRATTVSGDIVASGIRGSIDINSTSGDITLGGERVTSVAVDASSANISFEGTLGDDARVQISTHSGDVTLRLPESVGGLLDISTFNGDVSAPSLTLLPSAENMVRGFAGGSAGAGAGANAGARAGTRGVGFARRYEFGGGGSARISISTFNGDVVFRRGTRSRLE